MSNEPASPAVGTAVAALPARLSLAATGQVLVTGSAAGIGLTIAERLLAEGWQVLGVDVAPAVIRQPGYQHQVLDLTDAAALAAWLLTLGPVDALIHAAGLLRVAPLGALASVPDERLWQLNVAAATRLADALAPGMVQRGRGRIVLIGSRVAHGMAGRSQYAATKAALVALARSWAAEVAGHGVTVNVIAPAATRTAMLADPARATSQPRLPPLGRLIEPAEIAALTAFLLSPHGAAITGQDLAVCGGASLSS